MYKILAKINRLSLPATILIASLVLGGFYFAGEISKQKSVERQEIQKENNDLLEKYRLECDKINDDNYAQFEKAIKLCVDDTCKQGVVDSFSSLIGNTAMKACLDSQIKTFGLFDSSGVRK